MNRRQLLMDNLPLEDIPLCEYPRPQFKRDSYLCLNGEWEFKTSYLDNDLEGEYKEKIIVPYSMESYLSSINRYLNKGEYLYYRKIFKLDNDFNKGRVVLHFDAVDQIAEIYLNNNLVATHEGGYLPFEVDITSYLKEENTLIVKVQDDLDLKYGYGKQTKVSKGMWYTKTSGIWKTVWLESTKEEYFNNVKIDVTLSSVTLTLDTNVEEKTIIIHTENGDIIRTFKENKITIDIDNPHLWSPEDPYLYYFELIGEDDKIESYFALRTIKVSNDNIPFILLNDQPYFFHGLLDQGYFPDGLLTPKAYKKYEDEILALKELGFNVLRKHIKIEPLYFYYLCDKLGMIVFQDMVNNSSYSFIRDTALPTIGLLRWKNKGKHVLKENKEQFIKECRGTLDLLYNSPSVLYYTIFNEGWGQFECDRVFEIVKSIDSSRIIDATSGWFFGDKSDVDSYHVYFKKIKVKTKKRPIIISEFGGYVYKELEHSFNLENTYGYKIYKTKEEFQKGLSLLYLTQIVPLIKKGVCGAIYTQVSDVEDETNGLFTYDRKILKVSKTQMLEIKNQIEKEIQRIKKM